MIAINYKESLERYQVEIRDKITDIQKRMCELNRDILSLSTYIQSGIFYNCVAGMQNKIDESEVKNDNA